MYSYVTGGFVCGIVHQFFWLFVLCTFDMFRRWYYVVCMVCFLYWVLVHCWFVCNCVRVSVVVVCYCDPYLYLRDVCWCCDICVCVICVLCQIFVLKR